MGCSGGGWRASIPNRGACVARRPQEILRRLGTRLRDARSDLGLTQADVADRAGVSVNYVSELERGLRNPTVLSLHRIVTAGLGADLGQLLGSAAPRRGTAEPYPTASELRGITSPASDGSASTRRAIERRLAILVAGTPPGHRRRLRALLGAITDLLK
ncbi:MAG: helix-turn-helix domain-containing protein [Deltaproteobacteria bacterium]|nr:helix-turn-helix domain-containing protein [Deltaproteobacteria bacterium]